MLTTAGIRGFVEPLGFAECSLRHKEEAIEAIEAVGGADVFRVVHDTFHHYVAGETKMFPKMTGLVHISALRVHVPSTDKTLLAISGETGWQGLNPCPGLHRLPDTRECNLMSWGTSASLLLPALDLGPTALEITVDVGIRFSAELEGLSSLLVPQAPAEAAKTREEQGSPEGDKAGPLTESEVPHTDLVTAAIRAAKLRQSLAQLEEGGRNLAALEAAVAELAASNRAHVESLLSQNDEIRRLEAVNRVAGEALIELREQLTASQRWLGELRNRTLVRLSLAIHREKWPL